MSQLSYRTLTGLLASSLLLAACSDGSNGEEPQSGELAGSLMTPAPALSSLIPMLVDATDQDAAHGMNLTMSMSGTSSPTIVAAVLSGAHDFGAAAPTTVVDAVNEGADLVIVCSMAIGVQTLAVRTSVAQELGVTQSSPLEERVEALRGLTIVTTAPGSGSYALLGSILRNFGLDPEKDVTIVTAQDTGAIVAGLRRGQFDGGFYSAGVLEANIASGDAEYWGSLGDDDLQEAVGETMAGVIFAKRSTVEENPRLVQAMHDSLEAAEEELASSDPGQTAEFAELVHEKFFAELDESIFDLAWENAAGGMAKDCTYSQDNLDQAYVELGKDASDFENIDYSELVYSAAQG